MDKEEIKEVLRSVDSNVGYAIGKLDEDYGYDNAPALVMLDMAIDEMCKLEELNMVINVSELKYWKEFISQVINSKDRENKLTIAVAYAIKQLVSECKECYI